MYSAAVKVQASSEPSSLASTMDESCPALPIVPASRKFMLSYYAAPELVAAHMEGEAIVKMAPPADVWLLGMMLYEMVIDHPAFGANPDPSKVSICQITTSHLVFHRTPVCDAKTVNSLAPIGRTSEWKSCISTLPA
jgi:hypothetical protein